MWNGLAYFGLFVILTAFVGVLARAARSSGLEEFTLVRFRFKGDDKPTKQLPK